MAGVVDAGGRRVVSYGSLAKNDNRKLDGDTVFEIGSLTKVFTSLVLMDMVRRGEVALSDPVSKYLAESVRVPERNGRKITFADLSTQSSGLPRMPNNFNPKDPTPQGVDDIGRHLLNASYPLLKVEAPAEHKQITLDTKTYDRYVGQYQLGPNAIMTISRDGDRFYSRLTNQGKVEVFPESERKFFMKVVDAQLTFDVDAQGTATELTLHQNGRDIAAKRMNEADIKRAAGEGAAIAQRFKDQKQAPGTEAALRRNIEELQRGEPNYEQMALQLAGLTRQQLPQLKATMAQLGAVQSLTFTGVGPGGADIYQVKFERGSAEWRIVLGSDGKAVGLGFRPTQ